MDNLSMNQALSIWSELWRAYYNDNGYGGDTAEIYAYTLMNYDPIVTRGEFDRGTFQETELFKEQAGKVYDLAKSALIQILIKFEVEAECTIEVNGKPVRDWASYEERFSHRCHVRVIDQKKFK